MNAMRVAQAAAAETNVDAKLAEAVVRMHMQQYPGSWQEWALEERVPYICKILRAAQAYRETSAARIVLLYA